jgi:hypothetical protein
VIECEPTDRLEVENVAVPVESSVPVPSVAVPSENVTVPVGVPAPGADAATVAVNVTDCPNTDALGELDTLVDESALFTVCVNGLAVLSLAVKF